MNKLSPQLLSNVRQYSLILLLIISKSPSCIGDFLFIQSITPTISNVSNIYIFCLIGFLFPTISLGLQYMCPILLSPSLKSTFILSPSSLWVIYNPWRMSNISSLVIIYKFSIGLPLVNIYKVRIYTPLVYVQGYRYNGQGYTKFLDFVITDTLSVTHTIPFEGLVLHLCDTSPHFIPPILCLWLSERGFFPPESSARHTFFTIYKTQQKNRVNN